MVRLKRIAALACAACLFVFGCVMLSACSGEQDAATWAHGKVTEDEVTTAVNNMRSNYGLTDSSSWQSFIEGKYYDTSAQASASTSESSSSSSKKSNKKSNKKSSKKSNSKKSSSKSSSSASSSDSSAESSSDSSSESSVGTVQDLRTYVINQLIRQQVIDYEVQQQNIQVSDDEVNAYVDQARQQVESQYMEGVFESYLETQQGMTLDEFKEQAKETLAEQKLQQQATGSTTDTDAWNKYVDDLVSKADVKINDAPANLPYDPANASASSSASSETDADATAEESTDTAADADATATAEVATDSSSDN